MKNTHSNTLVLVGFGLTTAWVCAGGAYFYTAWPAFKMLKPNEVGDFLAGAFAPLAFLWLVITVFVQQKQLKIQSEELKNQIKEMQEAREEQKGQRKALNAQTRIMESDHKATRLREIEAELTYRLRPILGISHKWGLMGNISMRPKAVAEREGQYVAGYRNVFADDFVRGHGCVKGLQAMLIERGRTDEGSCLDVSEIMYHYVEAFEKHDLYLENNGKDTVVHVFKQSNFYVIYKLCRAVFDGLKGARQHFKVEKYKEL